MLFVGQAGWTKLTSPWDKLKTLACRPTKSCQTNLSLYKHQDRPRLCYYQCDQLYLPLLKFTKTGLCETELCNFVSYCHRKLWQLIFFQRYHGQLTIVVYVATPINNIQKEIFLRVHACGLYYESFMIVIYDRNDCTIVIYHRNDSGQYYKTTITAKARLSKDCKLQP